MCSQTYMTHIFTCFQNNECIFVNKCIKYIFTIDWFALDVQLNAKVVLYCKFHFVQHSHNVRCNVTMEKISMATTRKCSWKLSQQPNKCKRKRIQIVCVLHSCFCLTWYLTNVRYTFPADCTDCSNQKTTKSLVVITGWMLTWMVFISSQMVIIVTSPWREHSISQAPCENFKTVKEV